MLTAFAGAFVPVYPTRPNRSAWMGTAVHSAQGVFIVGAVVALVL